MTFGADTTTDEILAGVDLAGRHVMITGASSGLGEQSARALASAGATVTMLARDQGRLDEAVARVQAAAPDATLRQGIVDLADLASIRAFAATDTATALPIDVLLNNAGVMACPQMATADGFEMQFGTNHLGHFLLTNLLLPSLQAGTAPRIVNLSSGGHSISDTDLADPNFETTPYDAWESYGRSKTANVLFTRALAARHPEIVSLAVHPGAIVTNLGRHLDDEMIKQMMARTKARNEANDDPASAEAGGMKFKSVEAGAATQVWAVTAAELADHSGSYLGDCQLGEMGGNPSTNGFMPYAYDDDKAERLWTLSEQLVGL